MLLTYPQKADFVTPDQSVPPPPKCMCTPPPALGQATSNVAKHPTGLCNQLPEQGGVGRGGTRGGPWVPEGDGCLACLPAGLTAVAPGGGGRPSPLSVPCRVAPVTPWLPLSTDGKGRQPQEARGGLGVILGTRAWRLPRMAGGGSGGGLGPGNS